MGGRYLEVKPANGRVVAKEEDTQALVEAMPTDCKTLFVKGLPYTFKEDDIGDRFRPFGEVKEIRLTKNWQTGQSKGFCYVVFAENSAAKAALMKMNGKELKGHPGRSLKVDFDVKQSAKGSYKTNMADEGNVRFNKHVKKDFKQKHNRKEREKTNKTR